MAPPDDETIGIDELLHIATDEVMWSLFADSLHDIKDTLEYTGAYGKASGHGVMEIREFPEEFESTFIAARNAVVGALETAFTRSKGLEQALADAYAKFGTAEEQAIAAATIMSETVQWQNEAETPLAHLPQPFFSGFKQDWRELMDNEGGYER